MAVAQVVQSTDVLSPVTSPSPLARAPLDLRNVQPVAMANLLTSSNNEELKTGKGLVVTGEEPVKVSQVAHSITKVVKTATVVTARTALERELQSIEGLRKYVTKPPAEVVGRVSVVTPTTASRAHFHEQLWQCFVDQNWPDKELVVVETYTQRQKPSAVFTRLVQQKEKRLKYIAIQVEEGEDFTVGAKRNMTVLMSSGQYCVNFDDDDLYAPSYVARMVTEMRRRNLVALTLSAWHNFFESSGRCGYSTPQCWEPEDEKEYEGILYGYGFSYVHLRVMALAFPYPNLGFAEDAPFMLKLREKMGAARVGLMEDREGLCLHIVHPRSSTPDPSVETILSDEELNALVVSDSVACRLHLKRPWFPSLWSSC